MTDYYVEIDTYRRKRIWAGNIESARLVAIDYLHNNKTESFMYELLGPYGIKTPSKSYPVRTQAYLYRQGVMVYTSKTGNTPVGIVEALDRYYWIPRKALESGEYYHYRIYSDGTTAQKYRM